MSRVVVITGGSKGIGRSVAYKFAEEKARIIIMHYDPDESASEETLKVLSQKGVEAESHKVDVSSFEAVAESFKDVLSRFEKIDVLVNNAGAARHESVQEADMEAWRQIMDLNFNAVAYLSRQVLPAMIERGSGSIVNISSISGRTGAAGNGVYSASKHALNGLSECMYEDVRDHGIKVSSIMPGFVETSLTGNMGLNAGNMMASEDVADAVEYVLSASPRCCPTEIVLRPQLRP